MSMSALLISGAGGWEAAMNKGIILAMLVSIGLISMGTGQVHLCTMQALLMIGAETSLPPSL